MKKNRRVLSVIIAIVLLVTSISIYVPGDLLQEIFAETTWQGGGNNNAGDTLNGNVPDSKLDNWHEIPAIRINVEILAGVKNAGDIKEAIIDECKTNSGTLASVYDCQSWVDEDDITASAFEGYPKLKELMTKMIRGNLEPGWESNNEEAWNQLIAWATTNSDKIGWKDKFTKIWNDHKNYLPNNDEAVIAFTFTCGVHFSNDGWDTMAEYNSGAPKKHKGDRWVSWGEYMQQSTFYTTPYRDFSALRSDFYNYCKNGGARHELARNTEADKLGFAFVQWPSGNWAGPDYVASANRGNYFMGSNYILASDNSSKYFGRNYWAFSDSETPPPSLSAAYEVTCGEEFTASSKEGSTADFKPTFKINFSVDSDTQTLIKDYDKTYTIEVTPKSVTGCSPSNMTGSTLTPESVTCTTLGRTLTKSGNTYVLSNVSATDLNKLLDNGVITIPMEGTVEVGNDALNNYSVGNPPSVIGVTHTVGFTVSIRAADGEVFDISAGNVTNKPTMHTTHSGVYDESWARITWAKSTVDNISWNYHTDPDVDAYAEIVANQVGYVPNKSGDYAYAQDWNVNTGIPSTENLSVAAGGQLFQFDIGGFISIVGSSKGYDTVDHQPGVMNEANRKYEVYDDKNADNYGVGSPMPGAAVTRDITFVVDVINSWEDNDPCVLSCTGHPVASGGGTMSYAPGTSVTVTSNSDNGNSVSDSTTCPYYTATCPKCGYVYEHQSHTVTATASSIEVTKQEEDANGIMHTVHDRWDPQTVTAKCEENYQHNCTWSCTYNCSNATYSITKSGADSCATMDKFVTDWNSTGQNYELKEGLIINKASNATGEGEKVLLTAVKPALVSEGYTTGSGCTPSNPINCMNPTSARYTYKVREALDAYVYRSILSAKIYTLAGTIITNCDTNLINESTAKMRSTSNTDYNVTFWRVNKAADSDPQKISSYVPGNGRLYFTQFIAPGYRGDGAWISTSITGKDGNNVYAYWLGPCTVQMTVNMDRYFVEQVIDKYEGAANGDIAWTNRLEKNDFYYANGSSVTSGQDHKAVDISGWAKNKEWKKITRKDVLVEPDVPTGDAACIAMSKGHNGSTWASTSQAERLATYVVNCWQLQNDIDGTKREGFHTLGGYTPGFNSTDGIYEIISISDCLSVGINWNGEWWNQNIVSEMYDAGKRMHLFDFPFKSSGEIHYRNHVSGNEEIHTVSDGFYWHGNDARDVTDSMDSIMSIGYNGIPTSNVGLKYEGPNSSGVHVVSTAKTMPEIIAWLGGVGTADLSQFEQSPVNKINSSSKWIPRFRANSKTGGGSYNGDVQSVNVGNNPYGQLMNEDGMLVDSGGVAKPASVPAGRTILGHYNTGSQATNTTDGYYATDSYYNTYEYDAIGSKGYLDRSATQFVSHATYNGANNGNWVSATTGARVVTMRDWVTDSGTANANEHAFSGSLAYYNNPLVISNIDMNDFKPNGVYDNPLTMKTYYIPIIEYEADSSLGIQACNHLGATAARMTLGAFKPSLNLDAQSKDIPVLIYSCKYSRSDTEIKSNPIVIHDPISTEFCALIGNGAGAYDKYVIDESHEDMRVEYEDYTEEVKPNYVVVGNTFHLWVSDYGDFYDPRASFNITSPSDYVGVGNSQDAYTPNGELKKDGTGMTVAKGYANQMLTEKWVKARWVVFDFPISYVNNSGKTVIVPSGTPVNLANVKKNLRDDKEYYEPSDALKTFAEVNPEIDKVRYGTDYTFTCLMSAKESTNAGVTIYSFAKNSANYKTEDQQRDFILSRAACKSDNQERILLEADSVCKTRYGIQIVGRLGNLAIEDSSDFRFSTTFKQGSSTEWLIDNVMKKSDLGNPRLICSTDIDIINRKIEGSISHSTLSVTNFNVGNTAGGKAGQYLKLPLMARYNSVKEFATEQMRLGYSVYADIETIGNYYGINSDHANQKTLRGPLTASEAGKDVNGESLDHRRKVMKITPLYILYDYSTGTYIPVDLYYGKKGSYKLFWSTEVDSVNIVDEDAVNIYNSLIAQDGRNRSNVSYIETTLNDRYKEFDTTYISAFDEEDFIGTPRCIVLDQFDRTYIGSSILDGNIQKGQGTSIVGEEAYSFDRTTGRDLWEKQFFMQSQRWYFNLGLPSSTLVAYQSTNRSQSNIIDSATKLKNEHPNSVLLCFIKIEVSGDVYTLKSNYSIMSSDNNICIFASASDYPATYNGSKSHGTISPYTSEATIRNFGVDVKVKDFITKEYIPLVIMDPYESSADDWDTYGTH